MQSVKQAGLKNTQKMRVASLEEQLKAIEALIVERTAYKTQLEAELQHNDRTTIEQMGRR